MGAFSKALKDAQYLMPLSQSLVNYKKQQDEMEGRKKLLELMDQMTQYSQEQMKPQYQNVSTPDKGQFEVAPNSLLEGVMRGGQNNITPVQPEQVPLQGEKPFTSVRRPEILAPGQVQQNVDKVETFNPQKNPGDYRTASNDIKGKFSQIIGKYALDPNVSPEQLNQVLQLTQMGIPSAPIGTSTIERDPKKDLYSVDENGKQTLLKKGESPDKNTWTKLGEGSIGGVDYAWMRNYSTGEVEKFPLGKTQPKGTSVTVDNTGTAELIRQLKLGNTLGNLESARRRYAELDAEHNKPGLTDIQKQKIQKQKDDILNNELAPGVKDARGNIAQQFPTLGVQINDFLSDPEIIANPERIDEIISEDLKGTDEYMISVVKEIVKSQLFNSETLPK